MFKIFCFFLRYSEEKFWLFIHSEETLCVLILFVCIYFKNVYEYKLKASTQFLLPYLRSRFRIQYNKKCGIIADVGIILILSLSKPCTAHTIFITTNVIASCSIFSALLSNRSICMCYSGKSWTNQQISFRNTMSILNFLYFYIG